MNQAAFKQMIEIQEAHWWFQGKREIVKKLIITFANKEPLKILEIGCGTGSNLKLLSKLGKTIGLEVDGEAIKYAERLTGIKVLEGSLPDNLQCIADQKFDVICLLDVLEHVAEDEMALCNIRNNLSSYGKIIITVPAYQWMYSEHDRHLSHYRRYSVKQLSQMLEKSGYKVLYKSYANTFLFPAMLLDRLVDKVTLEHGLGAKVPCAFLNTILYKIFCMEARLLPTIRFPFGGSVVAVAEVNQ